jgi:OOP family OmpA-OmpF porin
MKKISIALLLSAFIAAPAVAADTGYYAGVNVGSAKIDFPGFETTTSIEVLGGYSFNEYFAAEVAYTNFGSKDYPPSYNVKSDALSLKAVGSFPINEQFSVFAKLGIASTNINDTGYSQSKSDLTYGIGGQFNVNKQVGIRLGYDVYKATDVISLDQKNTSVGVVFKF